MFEYFLFLAPAILLMMWAQYRVRHTYAEGMRVPTALSGAAAARHILDTYGLPHVEIEIRQDLIADAAGQEAWAARLARLLPIAEARLRNPLG